MIRLFVGTKIISFMFCHKTKILQLTYTSSLSFPLPLNQFIANIILYLYEIYTYVERNQYSFI